MASCQTCGFSPCCCDSAFTRLDDMQVGKTLVATLTPCVDRIRDLYTCFGARAYEVLLVHTRWTGGERGVGVEEVIKEEVILPTPLVENIGALITDSRTIGEEELGVIDVRQISARYTEDQLRGYDADGTTVPDDQNFYWEVRVRTDDGGTQRRRFMPDNAPSLDPLKFEWTVRLVKIYEDRTRSGDPRG